MTMIGLIVCAIGVLGFLANFTGFYMMPPPYGNLYIWGGAAVIGAVTAMLTRRASD
ncbi:MAG: hypothetical protein AMXMBFR4_10350 [Candidatus Hydrogenedentota bacterium]